MGPHRPPGFHGTPRDEDRRDVQTHGGHLHAGCDLVAIRNTDQCIGDVGLDHVLDAIRDQVPGRQGVEHAAVAHRDAVVDGDRIKLDAPAARSVDDLLDALAHVVEMNVAGDELGKAIGDRDDRLRKVGVGHARRAPERAGASHISSCGGCSASISLHGREDRGIDANSHEGSVPLAAGPPGPGRHVRPIPMLVRWEPIFYASTNRRLLNTTASADRSLFAAAALALSSCTRFPASIPP